MSLKIAKCFEPKKGGGFQYRTAYFISHFLALSFFCQTSVFVDLYILTSIYIKEVGCGYNF